MQPRELVNCHVRELNSPTHQFTNSPILDLAVLVELNTGDLAELADAQDLGSCVRKDVWVRLPQSPTFAHACKLSVSYGWQAMRRMSTVARSAEVDLPGAARATDGKPSFALDRH